MASEILTGSDELIACGPSHLRKGIRSGRRASCCKLRITPRPLHHQSQSCDEIFCEGDSVKYKEALSFEIDGRARVRTNLNCSVEAQPCSTNAKTVDKVMTDVVGEYFGHLLEPTIRWKEAIYDVDDVATHVGRVRLFRLPMRRRAHRPKAKRFASHENEHHECKIEGAKF